MLFFETVQIRLKFYLYSNNENNFFKISKKSFLLWTTKIMRPIYMEAKKRVYSTSVLNKFKDVSEYINYKCQIHVSIIQVKLKPFLYSH